MTSLRGPDPYDIAEERLARLASRRGHRAERLCRMLHESIPTYTWAGVLRRAPAGSSFAAQYGTPRRDPALTDACAALLATEGVVVVHDVTAAPDYRACFPEARALAVVPAGPAAALVVTSEYQGAFGLADRALLILAARHLATP